MESRQSLMKNLITGWEWRRSLEKKVCRHRSDFCGSNGKFLQQEADRTNATVQVLIVTVTNTWPMPYWPYPQAQRNFEGDVHVHICHENVVVLQFHTKVVQVCSYVRDSQDQAMEPSQIGDCGQRKRAIFCIIHILTHGTTLLHDSANGTCWSTAKGQSERSPRSWNGRWFRLQDKMKFTFTTGHDVNL